MNINIKNTFKVTGRNLFVITTDADYSSLKGIKKLYDRQREKSFPVVSVEWVNSKNVSMAGITLAYASDEDLVVLEKLVTGYAIVE